MVKLKDHLHIPLPPRTLELGEGDDQLPVTPMNRSFPAFDTDSFATAILSPNSNDVFAARARARSRSDAPPISSSLALSMVSNTVLYSPSLDSFSTLRPCNTINETDTPSCDGKQDDKLNVPTMQDLNESPSFGRRSRLLTSTGAPIFGVPQDPFAPLQMQGVNQDSVVARSSFHNDHGAHSTTSVATRPRAKTISVSSKIYSLASMQSNDFSDNVKSFPLSKTPSRLRTTSHLDGGPGDKYKEENMGKVPFSTVNAAPVDPWVPSLALPSSSISDQYTTQLSRRSSLASLGSPYDSSFESSLGTNEFSLTLSNSFSETNDTSLESTSQECASWKSLQNTLDFENDINCEDSLDYASNIVGEDVIEASSTVSVASISSTVATLAAADHFGRRKSHTISEVGAHRRSILVQHEQSTQQDVFGPTTSVLAPRTQVYQEGYPIQQIDTDASAVITGQLSPTKPYGQLNVNRSSKPRRLTLGGALPTTASTNARMALHRHYKPENSPKSKQVLASKENVVSFSIQDLVTREQSLTAFQELIQDIKKERPIQSNAIAGVKASEPQSIGAILEYKPSSPTGHRPDETGEQECELCGAVARRLTILEPCGHYACAVCCSSGLNQVTATPPRPHTCAACQAPVIGITLRTGSGYGLERDFSEGISSAQGTPRSQQRHRRPQTPSPDEQRLLYRSMYSSSPTKSITPMQGKKNDQRRMSGGRRRQESLVANHKIMEQLANESNETVSSDLFTEDQSFYQSQRTIQQLNKRYSGLMVSPVLYNNHCVEQSFVDLTLPRRTEGVRSMTAQGTSIVRIDNIPWTVMYKDVVDWLPHPSDMTLPDSDVSSAAIHIPVEVFSGKTSNCCFVECKNKEEAMRLVRHRNNSRLLGRPVSEYRWKSKWHHSVSNQSDSHLLGLMVTTLNDLLDEIFPARAESPSLEDHDCIFFTAVHLRQLVELLRRGGAQLKGPLKIVDMTTSMIRLVPANMSVVMSEMRECRSATTVIVASWFMTFFADFLILSSLSPG